MMAEGGDLVRVAYEAFHDNTKERISGICSTNWRDEKEAYKILFENFSEVTA